MRPFVHPPRGQGRLSTRPPGSSGAPPAADAGRHHSRRRRPRPSAHGSAPGLAGRPGGACVE